MTEFFSSINQYHNLGLLALRLAIGTIFLIHGTAKIKKGTPLNFQLLGLSEILSAITIMIGFLLLFRFAALWLIVVMLGAIYMKKMKWHIPFAPMDKMGWEFDLILLAANFMIFAAGAGNFAIIK